MIFFIKVSCVPFRMACELVTEDGDTVDGTAGLKVCLDIFGRRAVVNLRKVGQLMVGSN
jgi:hypothetical protein